MRKNTFTSLLLITHLIVCLTAESSQAQWTTNKLSVPRQFLAATSVGTKVLFGGGFGSDPTQSVFLHDTINFGTPRVDIFDVSTGIKSTTATLSQARAQLAATSAGGKAFFAGGRLFSFILNVYSNRVDIFDDATSTWSTATLSQARTDLVATSVGTKVFFAGGDAGNNGLSAVVDIYDTATGIWSTSSLSVARAGLAATSVGTKAIFAGGRTDNNSGAISQVVDIYDTATGLWTTSTLPGIFSGPSAATSIGTKAFFAGVNVQLVQGQTTGQGVVYMYETATGTWSTTYLATGRYSLVATSVGTKAFFAGGMTVGNYAHTTDVVDIYNSATNQWTTSNLSRNRTNLAAASVGTYAFFGGGGPDGSTNSDVVDIYNNAAVLPVNLTSFKGQWTDDAGAVLGWTTAQEINNDYFEVQRSGDAKIFASIGRVKGHGTSSVNTTYGFTDAAMPDAVNYYRLKQVDIDGSIYFSATVAVSRTRVEPSLLLHPNPVQELLTVEVTKSETIKRITIYDPQGKTVLSSSIPSMNVASFMTGTYVVEVLTEGGKVFRQRFIKQ